MYHILVEVSYLILMYTSIATRALPPHNTHSSSKRSTRLSGSRISVGGQKSGTSSAEFTIRPFRRLLCSPFLHGTPPSVPCMCTSPSLSIRHSSPLLLYNYRTLLAQEEMSYLTGQYGTVTWLEDIP